MLAVALALSAIFATGASADLQGPMTVVPGGLNDGHGGNTCYSESSADGAEGKGPGQTRVYGGDTDTTAQVGCDFNGSPATPTAFDTTRFDALYWGATGLPSLALNGDVVPGDSLTLAPNTGAPNSDYANGKVVWTGSTDMAWCDPNNCGTFNNSIVSTRLVLTIKDQNNALVPLTDALTVEGIPNPGEVGAVVSIDGTVQRFTANYLFEAERPADAPGPTGFQPALDMFNSLNHPLTPSSTDGFNTHSSFSSGFWYEGKDPTAEFTFPAPQNGQPVTFTSTSSDPDGEIDTQLWDLDNDGQFDDAQGPTAQSTFGPGTHTVLLRVADTDSDVDTVSHQFTVTNANPTANFTFPAPQNGVPVTFTSTSTDSDGTIASRAWDLDNDGAFDDGTGNTASSTFGPGSHSVRLQVTDNNGGIGTVTKTFTVATPPDKTAPTVTLTLTKAKLGKILARGLKGKLNVNEAARTVLKVTLPKALAKRLKLRGAIGSVTVVHTAAGNKAFTIKIKPKAKRKLKRQRSVKFIVAGTPTDTAGNKKPVKKSLTARK